jgi:hypothetical protein
MTTTRPFLLALIIAGTFALVGCENPGGATRGGGTAARPDTGEPFAAGKTVPTDARQIDQTTNGRLIHRAQRAGSVWVEDVTTGKVIYSGMVRADSNVVVDAKADAVAINDQQVRHAPKLDSEHKYRLYFKGL